MTLEEEARALFLDDPSLSVHDVARILNKKHGNNDGLASGVITRVRREVRLAIEKAQQSVLATPPTLRSVPQRQYAQREPVRPLPTPEPFNPPHFPIQKEEPPAPPKAPLEEPDAKPEQSVLAQLAKPSTKAERVKWLEDYVLTHPHTTIDQARSAVKAQFGVAVGTAAICATLALVREYNKKPTTLPPPGVNEIVAMMERAGLRHIEILSDGGVMYHHKEKR